MKHLSWLESRAGWRVLLSVFLTGVLAGVLLARVWTRTPAGDFLTALSLLVVGLGAGAVLFGLGWIAGAASRRATAGTGIGEQTPTRVESEKGRSLASPPATANEAFLPVQVVTLAPGEIEPLTPFAPALPRPARTVDRQPVTIGSHIRLLQTNGKWVLSANDIFGYESLQFSVGLNPGWLVPRGIAVGRGQIARELSLSLHRSETIALVLFIASLCVYAATRLFALDQFPINFFADEANQVVIAMELVKRGLRDPQGGFLPMYFNVFFFNNPDIAVYFHVVSASLFGKSIVVARATSALVTVIAAGAVGLLLRQVFHARYWWAVVLLLAITPAWFLFSRTAFDTAAMASLYGLFIVSYLFYRYRSPRYIYPALIIAAATFYAYPSGQPAIGLLALFLLVSDFRYHLQHRRTLLWAIPLVLVLAIPFIRFEMLHPDEAAFHLRAVNSFWMQNIPLSEKLGRTVSTYLQLLSPGTWFLPNEQELMRHRMKDYGFLPLIELPLILIGVGGCLRHFRESRYRAALAGLFIAPVGAALADIGILRALAFVIPAAIVSALGLEWLLSRIKEARAVALTSLALFGILGAMSVGMLQDALTNGPTWSSDYTLYGMQWGAKQIFQDTVPQLIADNPESPIYVSDTWANGTDVFVRFFDLDPSQVQVKGIIAWLTKKQSLDPNAIFIMTPDEYDKARTSPKFKSIDVQDTIKYPDGRNGFYVARVEYADNIDEIFAAEREALRQPVTDSVTIDGEVVQLSHTKFDIGSAQSLFDNDLYTVARGVEANPLVLDFKFSKPRTLHGVTLYLGKANTKVTARLYSDDAAQPVVYVAAFDNASISTGLPAGPPLQMNFDGGPNAVTRLNLEISYPNDDENAHVHVFELKFR